jgi:hypothetical protein
MRKSTPRIGVQANDVALMNTQHGLLALAYAAAARWGLLDALGQLTVKMKTRDYSWADKIATLWASIVIGLDFTYQINDALGAHERELARLFGFAKTGRFPDQSSVSRAVAAVGAEHVAQYRARHEALLHARTRARARHRWLRLTPGLVLLCVDIDQRGLIVRGKQFELAERGWFGQKPGRRGYQLSLCYAGGGVGEVVDEFFDPGATPALRRVPDFLASVARLCAALGLEPAQVLIRCDAGYGTPAIITQIQAYGFQFLLKTISHERARVLLEGVGPEAVFDRVKETSEGAARWMTDLGVVEHESKSLDEHRGERVRARTLLCVSRRPAPPRGARPGAATRARRAARGEPPRWQTVVDAYLTSLPAAALAVGAVLEVYDARTTIEHYFYDETYALGARHPRSHRHAGAALYQWLVATTSNLLKWMQQTTFSRTPFAQFGLKQLTRRVFQIPGLLRWEGRRLVLVLPLRHHLVRGLVGTWRLLRPRARLRAPVQMPLPLLVDPLDQGCLHKI